MFRSPVATLAVIWLSSVVALIPLGGALVVPVAILDASGTWLRSRHRGRPA